MVWVVNILKKKDKKHNTRYSSSSPWLLIPVKQAVQCVNYFSHLITALYIIKSPLLLTRGVRQRAVDISMSFMVSASRDNTFQMSGWEGLQPRRTGWALEILYIYSKGSSMDQEFYIWVNLDSSDNLRSFKYLSLVYEISLSSCLIEQ